AVYRLLPTPPRPTLFPYTTLFRSQLVRGEDDPGRALDHPGRPGDTPELLAAVLGAPEPLLRALRGDAVEHDHEGVVELRRHGPERRLGVPAPKDLDDVLAASDRGLPVPLPRGTSGGAPAEHGVVERLPDLPAVQVEEVVAALQDPVLGHAVAELPDLVPERGVVPVLDVDVVVLDVGRDQARQRDVLVEGRPVLVGRKQPAVLRGQPLSPLQDLVQRPVQRLSALQALEVAL